MLVLNDQMKAPALVLRHQSIKGSLIKPVSFPDPPFKQISVYCSFKKPFRHRNSHGNWMGPLLFQSVNNPERGRIDRSACVKQRCDGFPAG